MLTVIRNVSRTPYQHIKMISEGSCDTEDLRNGCWKFIFAITGLKCFYNWKTYTYFTIYFLLYKCSISAHKILLETLKNLATPDFETLV